MHLILNGRNARRGISLLAAVALLIAALVTLIKVAFPGAAHAAPCRDDCPGVDGDGGRGGAPAKPPAQASPPEGAVATGRGGWPPQPIGAQLSLEFYTQQEARLRARADGSVHLDSIDGMTENDASDANFTKRAGLSNRSCLSFESVKWPGRYLRQQRYRLKVQGGGLFDPAFNDDATFCPNDNRYESFAKRGYYLRNRDAQLVLSRKDPPPLEDQDAWKDTVLFERRHATLGLYVVNRHGWKEEGDNWVSTAYGACTGITPPWSRPRTKAVSWTMSHNGLPPWGTPRTVVRRVASNPAYGLYPWIRVTKRDHDSHVFKIQTGQTVCAF